MSKNIFNLLATLCIPILSIWIACPVFAEEKWVASSFNDNFWQSNPCVIWEKLQHEPISKLEQTPTSQDPTRSAWIKMAIIGKRYNKDIQQLSKRLIAWRHDNPNHPANELIPPDNSLASLSINKNHPKHIALLLPLQGNLSASGEAIRDGFLSGYYESLNKGHPKQIITCFDTSTHSNIAELYRQAVAKGADVIVGPLTKENVQSLLKVDKFNVPIIALNYTDGSLPDNFYEFGLSPIDEALQVAEKAWKDGYSHAIVIAPHNSWGKRIAQNTISHWEELGGKVTDTLYFANQTDFTHSIAKLLHVDPVSDRKKMKKENNKTVLEKQRRQDFDVIFLLTHVTDARSIVPTLKYYYASNVPIYSISSVYSGVRDPQKDSDLNGVIFPDIPWLLKKKSAQGRNSNRLYAVGRDAYLISNELSRFTQLSKFQFYAATGALLLNSQHQIYRHLPWAKIQDGHV